MADLCSDLVGRRFIGNYLSDKGLSCSALTGATKLTGASGKCQSSMVYTHPRSSERRCKRKYLGGFMGKQSAFLYQPEAVDLMSLHLSASYIITTSKLVDLELASNHALSSTVIT